MRGFKNREILEFSNDGFKTIILGEFAAFGRYSLLFGFMDKENTIYKGFKEARSLKSTILKSTVNGHILKVEWIQDNGSVQVFDVTNAIEECENSHIVPISETVLYKGRDLKDVLEFYKDD